MSTQTDNSPDQDQQNGPVYARRGNEDSTPLGGQPIVPSQEEVLQGLQDLEDFANTGSPSAAGSGAVPSGSLFRQEADAGEEDNSYANGGLYNKNDREDRKSFRKEGRQVVRVSKKQGLFGGITGLLVGGLFFGMSFTAGPAGFIHMAQLESHAHDSSQSNESNNRLSHALRYMYHAQKGQLEKARLTGAGNYLAKQYKETLAKSGFNLTYDGSGHATISFDMTHDNFKGKSVAELQAYSDEKLGGGKVVVGKDGVPQINVADKANTAKGALGKSFPDAVRYKIFGGVVNESGYGKVIGPLAKRILKKEAGVTLHPVTKAKGAVIDKARTTKAKLTAFLKEEGTYATQGAAASSLSIEGQDTKANDPQGANKDKVAAAADAGKEILKDGQEVSTAVANGDPNATANGESSIKSTIGKVGAGGAALIGVACVLKGIDTNSAKINQTEVVVPLIRIATEMLSLGSQMQGNLDLNTAQTEQYGKRLYNTDDQSLWTDARSVRALEGENPADGKAAPPTITGITDGTPFHFLNTGAAGATLGPICGVLEGIFSIPVLGTALSWAGALTPSGFLQYFAIGEGAKTVARWVSAVPIDIAAAGADFGSYVDYGAKLAANMTFLASGAKKLTVGEVTKLFTYNNELNQQDFNSHNLAYRLFNTGDYRTLISRIMDKQTPSPTQNLARIGGSLTNVGKLLASDVSSLFFSTVSAADSTTSVDATNQTYNYGIPTYGFGLDELSSPLVDDPFQNANDVSDILTQNAKDVAANADFQPNYVKQAQDCFSVQLTSTPNPDNPAIQIWDTNANQDTTTKQYYGQDYQSASNSDKCAGDTTDASGNLTITDQNWFKIRFFIFDTGTIKAAACYAGDGQSCTDIGVDNGTPAATTSSNTAIDLTTIYQDSSSVACAAGTTDEGIQDGYYNSQLVKIHTCGVPNIVAQPSEGKTIVNARVSGAFYAMGQAGRADGVPLYSESSFRTEAQQEALFAANPNPVLVARPGTSNHQMGLAIDFAPGPNGGAIVKGDATFTWLTANAATFGIKNYPAENWHWSPTGN
jgi:hypothetical protein